MSGICRHAHATRDTDLLGVHAGLRNPWHARRQQPNQRVLQRPRKHRPRARPEQAHGSCTRAYTHGDCVKMTAGRPTRWHTQEVVEKSSDFVTVVKSTSKGAICSRSVKRCDTANRLASNVPCATWAQLQPPPLPLRRCAASTRSHVPPPRALPPPHEQASACTPQPPTVRAPGRRSSAPHDTYACHRRVAHVPQRAHTSTQRYIFDRHMSVRSSVGYQRAPGAPASIVTACERDTEPPTTPPARARTRRLHVRRPWRETANCVCHVLADAINEAFLTVARENGNRRRHRRGSRSRRHSRHVGVRRRTTATTSHAPPVAGAVYSRHYIVPQRAQRVTQRVDVSLAHKRRPQ